MRSLGASLRSKPPPPSQFTTHHLAPHLSFNHAYPSPRLALFPVAAPFHFAPLPAPAAASADQIAGGGGGGSGEGGAEAGGGGEGRKEEVGEWRQWIQQALSSACASGKIRPRNKVSPQSHSPHVRFGKDPNLESGEPDEEELDMAAAVVGDDEL
ncbi:unnamed protein product [Closterium sp. Naga37s-1]|nr:unnamed protein product [Closterium sp. Naga37s-1]